MLGVYELNCVTECHLHVLRSECLNVDRFDVDVEISILLKVRRC